MSRFDDADLRTLALAAPPVTAEALDAFIRYQETLLALAQEPPATAHAVALQTSGLDARTLPGLRALCESFAGKRSAAKRIADRLRERPAETAEEVARQQKELEALRSPLPWTQRYGAERYRLLDEREAVLVRLHDALFSAASRLQPPALPV